MNSIESSIFKSYDIRGIYPKELDEEAIYTIGRAFVDHVGAKTVAVGRDIRTSSPSLFEALTRGIMDQGADVIDIGIATTPMLYFASWELETDGAIILTASHNPAQWNGMKMCRKQAEPIGMNSGMQDIKERAQAGTFVDPIAKGSITTIDITEPYFAKIRSLIDFGDKSFNIVIDTANAMGIYELPLYESLPNTTVTKLFDEPDGSFPNHEANPLNTETLTALSTKVQELHADIGIALDGDADRVGFVDEHGEPVSGDLILALAARDILEQNPHQTILYDVRCTRAVKEIVEELGGTAIETPVGHSNIKKLMREHNAVFAGEISMHFFFKDLGIAENTAAVVVRIMNMMAKTGKSLSELAAQVRRYHHSGEINYAVDDKEAIIAKLKEHYSDGDSSELDGIKVNYPDWWFNVRPSNTELTLRLNLEAKTAELLEEKKQELITHITG